MRTIENVRGAVAKLTLSFAGVAATLGLASGLAHAAVSASVPNSAAPRMYGDPAAAAQYWRKQSSDDCALMAVADVIGELTGRQPSEDEIIAVAVRLGSRVHAGPVYRSGYGTDPADIPVLLAQYGIYGVATSLDDAATGLDSGMEALERYLDGGHKVIAGVNAEMIWGLPVQTKDNRGNPASDHAVVVTGVDLVNGTVHLNDSASPSGPDEIVSLEVFGRSWATGNDEMVVTREKR
ncbi:C39 family peptidase [Mycobacterium sp. ML4]